MKKTTHVNFWSGPGTGKSSMAADVFSKLKWLNINSELISEYAKQLVWEGSLNKLENQIYIFAKQHKRHFDLENKVDLVITDSAIPLGLIYDNGNTDYLKDIVMSEFNKFDNLNIFLNRTKIYNPIGRTQTENEAIKKDEEILDFLINNNIDYIRIDATENTSLDIIEIIKSMRNELWNNTQ